MSLSRVEIWNPLFFKLIFIIRPVNAKNKSGNPNEKYENEAAGYEEALKEKMFEINLMLGEVVTEKESRSKGEEEECL
jgi:hypothetical protein